MADEIGEDAGAAAPRDAMHTLRAAAEALLARRDDAGTDPHLREALRRLAAEVRAHGTGPDVLLARLRALLDDLATAHHLPEADRARLHAEAAALWLRAYAGARE